MGSASNNNPLGPQQAEESVRQGKVFIAQVHQKMGHLVQEFASGKINRTQFHKLYDRYQRQIMTVSQLMAEADPTLWKDALDDKEDTLLIKKRLTAKAVGMSVYDNRSGMPIETLGEFAIDAELLVPMLSSYRSAAAEIFRAGMRSTEMENGQWLCFVPGSFTTLIALFSLEPSSKQLEMVERMHKDFEAANKSALQGEHIDPDKLAYPFYSFVQKRAQPVPSTGPLDDLKATKPAPRPTSTAETTPTPQASKSPAGPSTPAASAVTEVARPSARATQVAKPEPTPKSAPKPDNKKPDPGP